MNQRFHPRIRVLFVCMGNICRSPTAQGVFAKHVIEEGLSHLIEIDSAGTHAYHVGEPPDARARETAQRRGIDLSLQRARRAVAEDFERFDYVLAMDKANHRALSALCPSGFEGRLRLFMDYAPQLGQREVPDPYYGGANGFEAVFDMVDAASRGLLEAIRREHLTRA
ncbi:low molecular weight protein-tyrosine-phosphatase [Halochromatium salexigens]|uniref:protein-tyrosine-phosphatase n=1 Tax=Halochromatium salexigens TaxID=49447 RepID=A0AAJ0XFB2_HALSE|nr:low molecular weight protein-tyrosine-phosphatase [Halochromatium salexigens]MBK5929522.1 phosphotyrosine protein phosphatase [Halochromatium salexigens]